MEQTLEEMKINMNMELMERDVQRLGENSFYFMEKMKDAHNKLASSIWKDLEEKEKITEYLRNVTELTEELESFMDIMKPQIFIDWLIKNDYWCLLAVNMPIEKYAEYHPNPEELQKEFEEEYKTDYQVRERVNRAILHNFKEDELITIRQLYHLVEDKG
jgi:hypothetical protein